MPTTDPSSTRIALLERIMAAFTAHDLDAIMDHFVDDCVFDAPRGPDPWGRRLVGRSAVREAFAARFEGIPDVRYEDGRHWVSGDHGVSEWTITGTGADGSPIRARGCDHWEFRGDKIARKDSYWKIVEA